MLSLKVTTPDGTVMYEELIAEDTVKLNATAQGKLAFDSSEYGGIHSPYTIEVKSVLTASGWFMSYAQIYFDGRFQFGHEMYKDDEHPMERCARWNRTYGAGKFQCVVLSFQRQEVIECRHELSHAIGRE